MLHGDIGLLCIERERLRVTPVPYPTSAQQRAGGRDNESKDISPSGLL